MLLLLLLCLFDERVEAVERGLLDSLCGEPGVAGEGDRRGACWIEPCRGVVEECDDLLELIAQAEAGEVALELFAESVGDLLGSEVGCFFAVCFWLHGRRRGRWIGDAENVVE